MDLSDAGRMTEGNPRIPCKLIAQTGVGSSDDFRPTVQRASLPASPSPGGEGRGEGERFL